MTCDEDAVGPATTVTVTLQELCVGEVVVVGGGLVSCRHRCRKYSGHCGYPLVISPSPPPRARDQAGGVSVSRSVAGFPAVRVETVLRVPGPVDELSTAAWLACSDVVRGRERSVGCPRGSCHPRLCSPTHTIDVITCLGYVFESVPDGIEEPAVSRETGAAM